MGYFRGGQKWPQPANKKLKTDIYIIFNRRNRSICFRAFLLSCSYVKRDLKGTAMIGDTMKQKS